MFARVLGFFLNIGVSRSFSVNHARNDTEEIIYSVRSTLFGLSLESFHSQVSERHFPIRSMGDDIS
jgi:hypothetical protein